MALLYLICLDNRLFDSNSSAKKKMNIRNLKLCRENGTFELDKTALGDLPKFTAFLLSFETSRKVLYSDASRPF